MLKDLGWRTIKDVVGARLVTLNERQLRRLAAKGKLKAESIGQQPNNIWLIHTPTLAEYLEQRKDGR
jgi:hypothetical protein